MGACRRLSGQPVSFQRRFQRSVKRSFKRGPSTKFFDDQTDAISGLSKKPVKPVKLPVRVKSEKTDGIHAMKTTHVMLSTLAVATALLTSTGWAQEPPPILVWDETGALVSEGGYQSTTPAFTTQEAPSMATTERTFAMSPLTTGSIGDEQWVFDDHPFGNYGANIRLDDLRGQ